MQRLFMDGEYIVYLALKKHYTGTGGVLAKATAQTFYSPLLEDKSHLIISTKNPIKIKANGLTRCDFTGRHGGRISHTMRNSLSWNTILEPVRELSARSSPTWGMDDISTISATSSADKDMAEKTIHL